MTKKYSAHIFAICALFVLGNTIVTIPFYKLGILSLTLTVIFLTVLLLVVELLLKAAKKNKIVFYVTSIAICVIAVFGAIDTILALVDFLKAVMLPKTNAVLLMIPILLIVFAFLASSNDAVCKFGLIVSLICGLVIAVCFIGGIKIFDFSAVKQISQSELKAGQIIMMLLPAAVLPIFAREENCNIKIAMGGTVTGVAVLCLCFCQIVFTLGGHSNVEFPYLKAVSVISSGSLFTRLDGLVYFLFYVTCLIKITVCIKAFKKLITRNFSVQNICSY